MNVVLFAIGLNNVDGGCADYEDDTTDTDGTYNFALFIYYDYTITIQVAYILEHFLPFFATIYDFLEGFSRARRAENNFCKIHEV